MASKLRQDINIGSNIRKIRKEHHFTQEQVIAKLQLLGVELSRSAYSQIECGSYNIRVSELIALSEIFDITIDKFFENIGLK